MEVQSISLENYFLHLYEGGEKKPNFFELKLDLQDLEEIQSICKKHRFRKLDDTLKKWINDQKKHPQHSHGIASLKYIFECLTRSSSKNMYPVLTELRDKYKSAIELNEKVEAVFSILKQHELAVDRLANERKKLYETVSALQNNQSVIELGEELLQKKKPSHRHPYAPYWFWL